MGQLEGKTALVTGGALGIGLAVATRFAREGARVVLADRNGEGAAAAAAEIGAHARAVTMDISDEQAVAAAFAEIEADGWAPDVVVANAGVQLFGHDAPVADLDLDVWRRTIDINLTGTFLTVKHAVRSMLRSGAAAGPRGASIILTGSPTAVNGEGRDFTAYSASKAGMHGLGRTVAAAYAAQGIRVNTVQPAYTETPLVAAISEDPASRAAIVGRIPIGRAGTPDDVAGIMVYLASDDGAFATGATFQVDGGMTSL
jgi:NAD(P)-dependent dehydrogenase (short-subunit alcohol dehydrogenase family)